MITKEALIENLRSNILKIQFTKKDGSDRLMTCTLQEKLIPVYEKKTERVKAISDEIIVVWDLEKQAFRSFKLDSITNHSIVRETYKL